MRIILFYPSLVSDWNNGNAHFLRGVTRELQLAGHDVQVMEPKGGWSLSNLIALSGEEPVREFHRVYPTLHSTFYDPDTVDLERVLDGCDLALVHEWNPPALVARVGAVRARSRFRLFFHDTHHRSLTEAHDIAALDLRHYDGVLAFGELIRAVYLERGWAQRAWTWHEAADAELFRPLDLEPEGDLIWIGNWGDEERTDEYREFLLGPVRALGLRAGAHGVRYPPEGLQALAEAGIDYRGWLPNFRVPEVFARHRVTLHIPRRPYTRLLPGIPTIRVFEALACGIPLICTPWDDAERLFRPGEDYLIARDGRQMEILLRDVLLDESLRRRLAASGRATILARHTCRHRVDELMAICREVGLGGTDAGCGSRDTG